MLDPGLLDFGEAFTYVSALFTEGGTAPIAHANGIRLATGTSSGGYSTTQRLSDITPAAGKRLLVAGRFKLNNLSDANLWLGPGS
jgi:hypothetical protein